ncbi:TRAP transporter substrate-binding protein [Aestuariibacter salexigens]|uniref:TRAP transporter substrate-binding protein n=1 Tax=Aestuariibacter salexigens TaxID=226010 RepID=UPI0005522EEA|nr:TRAP transporter substrate-binding protein DctP [Aestuariibacter salexigens]
MTSFSRIVTRIALAVMILLVSACGGQPQSTSDDTAPVAQQTYKWKLVTSWPKNFPGLGRGPEVFAEMVQRMSNGRLQVKVYGAGELVPGFEVFDAVSQGTVQMGHAGSYYWKGKMPAAPIFSAIPFGMNSTEMNAWLHYGDGLKLWRELYQPFGVIPFAGGNTGVQMAGWFKKRIDTVDDLQGLKMRIPGLGGEVLEKVGGLPVALTGGEIFTALQTGAIDATEWVGPYNDVAFGLDKAAQYYYYSGWHEPATQLEFIVNEEAYNSLPDDLKAIVEVATRAVNQDMHNEYTARNFTAMQKLIDNPQIEVLPLPDDVMAALRVATEEVLAEESAADPMFAKIYKSYMKFYTGVKEYHRLSEQEYFKNR